MTILHKITIEAWGRSKNSALAEVGAIANHLLLANEVSHGGNESNGEGKIEEVENGFTQDEIDEAGNG